MLRAGSGDTGAFRLLMEKHQAPVMRMIYHYTGMHHEAEDLAQDIFITIYRAAGSYAPRAQFKTWLYKVHWTRVSEIECVSSGNHLSMKQHPSVTT